MWNLVFLQALLEENGCDIENLGQCTPIDLVCSTALSTDPDLIVISSVNGHGHIEGVDLVRRLRAHSELSDTEILIGGKLGISGSGNLDHGHDLVAAGYDAVFEASADPRATDRLVSLVSGSAPQALMEGAR